MYYSTNPLMNVYAKKKYSSLQPARKRIEYQLSHFIYINNSFKYFLSIYLLIRLVTRIAKKHEFESKDLFFFVV